MNHVIKSLLVVFAFAIVQNVSSQDVSDLTLNSDFAAHVKSIDEFICRFNGTEANAEIAKDSNWRKNNIIALFDFQMNHSEWSDVNFRRLIMNFVNQVVEGNAKLQITNAEMWAEANASMIVDGKKKAITLVLKSEAYKENRVRWAIAGVKGLMDVGIIDTTNYYAISPVEHEIHFMSLDGIFRNNHAEIMGFRSKDVVIDELSVFFTLVMMGKIEFCMVDKLTIHCLEVSGYAFTINEQKREGRNSGWLISRLIQLKNDDKKQYIKKLLNR